MKVVAALLCAMSLCGAGAAPPADGSSRAGPAADAVLAHAALALDPLRAPDLAAVRVDADPLLARIDPRDAATRKRKGIRRKVRIV